MLKRVHFPQVTLGCMKINGICKIFNYVVQTANRTFWQYFHILNHSKSRVYEGIFKVGTFNFVHNFSILVAIDIKILQLILLLFFSQCDTFQKCDSIKLIVLRKYHVVHSKLRNFCYKFFQKLRFNFAQCKRNILQEILIQVLNYSCLFDVPIFWKFLVLKII